MVVLVYLGSRHLCVFTSLRCGFRCLITTELKAFQRGDGWCCGGGGEGGGAAPLPPIPHDLTALPEYIRLKQHDH